MKSFVSLEKGINFALAFGKNGGSIVEKADEYIEMFAIDKRQEAQGKERT